MKGAGKVKRGLDWLRRYVSRGKELRAALRDATEFNADLADKAQTLKGLRVARNTAAAILRDYRPIVAEMRELASSGRTLGADELAGLRHRLLHSGGFHMNSDTRGVIPAMRGIGSPVFGPGSVEAANGALGPRYRITASDIDIVKKFLEQSYSYNARTRSKFKALEQYLGANAAKNADTIRRELRRYYLTNAGIGAAGAFGLGGAGYSAYKALSGEKKAAFQGRDMVLQQQVQGG